MSLGLSLLDYVLSGLFAAAFLVVAVYCATMAITTIKHWKKSNHSPIQIVRAVVVDKREAAARNLERNTGHFATFEFDGGKRLELSLIGTEYGMLAKGARGRLTFQGSRYLGFDHV